MSDSLRTERLRLRRWGPADREPFAAINADPAVARYLPASLTRVESDALIDRIEAHFEEHGFGLWAVEAHELVGFVGLMRPAFESRFTPCVEIGWRLGAAHWGHAYATEAARAVLHHAFVTIGLEEVVSFTVPANQPSLRVMERLGMTPDGEFEHPRLPPQHALRPHLLYRLSRARYLRLSCGTH